MLSFIASGSGSLSCNGRDATVGDTAWIVWAGCDWGGERWGPGSGEGDWGRRSVAVLLSHTHTHTVPSRAGDSIVDVAAEVVVERRA